MPTEVLLAPPLSETSPVGVPEDEVTSTVTSVAWPWVRVVGERLVSLVVVGLKLTDVHLLTRLAAFTEPSPVARSYPAVVAQAGEAVFFGSTRTPKPPTTVLLQSGEPPWQATELFPLTTS